MIDGLIGKKARIICALSASSGSPTVYVGTIEAVTDEFIKLAGKVYGDIKLTKTEILINRKYIAAILVDE